LYKRQKRLERAWIDQHKSILLFYKNMRRNSFFLWSHYFDRRYVVTQLCSNVGISVWWIVWVATNCCFMSDIMLYWQGKQPCSGRGTSTFTVTGYSSFSSVKWDVDYLVIIYQWIKCGQEVLISYIPCNIFYNILLITIYSVVHDIW